MCSLTFSNFLLRLRKNSRLIIQHIIIPVVIFRVLRILCLDSFDEPRNKLGVVAFKLFCHFLQPQKREYTRARARAHTHTHTHTHTHHMVVTLWHKFILGYETALYFLKLSQQQKEQEQTQHRQQEQQQQQHYPRQQQQQQRNNKNNNNNNNNNNDADSQTTHYCILWFLFKSIEKTKRNRTVKSRLSSSWSCTSSCSTSSISRSSNSSFRVTRSLSSVDSFASRASPSNSNTWNEVEQLWHRCCHADNLPFRKRALIKSSGKYFQTCWVWLSHVRKLWTQFFLIGSITGSWSLTHCAQMHHISRACIKVSRDTFHFPWKRKFSFSVFRVVQGEAKTPKIMGCCRANFAFLHALKIGTFRGKWTLEWVIKTSHFVLLALYFLITSKLAFSLIASHRCLVRTAKNVWVRAPVQKITFCLYDWKPI